MFGMCKSNKSLRRRLLDGGIGSFDSKIASHEKGCLLRWHHHVWSLYASGHCDTGMVYDALFAWAHCCSGL